MFSDARWIGGCCLVLIAALWGVGAVATPHPEPIRHFVQSLPIWAGVILGLRKSDLAKWVAFPFFVFWLFLMTCIWLFLLGWAHIVSGTFSATEITLTVIIGIISVSGIVASIRAKTATRPLAAVGALFLGAVAQVAAIALSLIPAIARR
jgi:hypothetical protein